MSSADPHHPAPVGREFCPSPEDLLPFAPDGLPEIAGGWAEREFELADRTFRLTLPAAPDALLDSPDVLAAHERDGYMPYWGYLWPTSLDMGTAVLREKWKPGLPTLEIGSGIGLVGLAGLAAGLQLVFSDYDPQSVRLALFNAAQNGFPQARGMMVDWRSPPATQYPLMLGCDLIYEQRNHEPILHVIDAMLAPGGVCWLADPGRHQADAFVRLARERGYPLEQRVVKREPFPGRPEGTTNLWLVGRRIKAEG